MKTLKDNGVWLEITNLLVPTWSDSPKMIQATCEWLVKNGFADTPLHFSRFFPTYKLAHLPPTSESILIQAKEIAENTGMKYVYIGYVVNKNFIHSGKCGFCGEPISGVWE